MAWYSTVAGIISYRVEDRKYLFRQKSAERSYCRIWGRSGAFALLWQMQTANTTMESTNRSLPCKVCEVTFPLCFTLARPQSTALFAPQFFRNCMEWLGRVHNKIKKKSSQGNEICGLNQCEAQRKGRESYLVFVGIKNSCKEELKSVPAQVPGSREAPYIKYGIKWTG